MISSATINIMPTFLKERTVLIEIHHETVSDIPLLHVVKAGHEKTALPFVIFVHGFTSAKEHNLHFAYLLAQKGFRVVLPEAMLHGERSDGRSVEQMSFEFWKIVIKTISELQMVKDYFMNKGIIDEEAIGLVGTSMGGIVTLGALTQYRWIQAAVSLMGNPSYVEFAKSQVAYLKEKNVNIPFSDEELNKSYDILRTYDLTLQANKLQERPLLFWHGKQDNVVPFQPTYDFFKTIKNDYKNKPAHLSFIVDEYAGHKVTREGLLKTVDWFETHLLKSSQ